MVDAVVLTFWSMLLIEPKIELRPVSCNTVSHDTTAEALLSNGLFAGVCFRTSLVISCDSNAVGTRFQDPLVFLFLIVVSHA